MNDPFYKLMLVTQKGPRSVDTYLPFIETCAKAGITSLQLREKGTSFSECVDFGLQLKEVLKPYSIPLIVNDSIDLALEIDADGLHLGQEDGCPSAARERLGAGKLIGLSIETIPQLKIANALNIDYVGISSVFPTSHKDNIKTIWELKGLRTLAKHSRHPMIGIGGITLENAASVINAGASGLAIIGAIHDAEDPEATVKTLKAITCTEPSLV